MSTKTTIDEQSICDYLSRHPDFLLNHPYVLLELDLHGKSQGLPNLALQQQRLLREQNQQLKQQLASMSRSALENEQIFKLLSECQRQLWHCNSFDELAAALAETLSRPANIMSCQLLPYDTELSQLVNTRLHSNSVYLGRLSKQEQQQLWPNNSEVRSVALYLIENSDKPQAILAFASDHAEHFSPSNDTLFMQEFVTTLQVRLSALA
ncbi:DUF484 family protein [Pseudoalteromonas byunsanensis]|uniref:DUF484 domain-containing protein n=1 Tax=Pseudoalteromonas byunsanensis TaxID=327939 RepID=A0A1S1NEI0_9GAMM|nr:DUF484 family protein [Pseudoalteromonas byunsanensis]OHU97976.1 hypothetical protein BIW53_00160 [Pseudoalteromonas byunsanensis]